MTSVRSCFSILSVALLLCGGIGCSSGGGSGTGGPKMRMASLQNKAGKFIEPTIASGQKALAAAKLPDDLIVWVSDPEGDESYPIVTYTWIIAYKKYADATEGKRLERRARLLSDRRSEGQRVAGLHTLADGSRR